MTELSAQGSTSYADIDMKTSMPSTSTLAYLNCMLIPASDGNTALLRPNGSSSTAGQYIVGSTSAKTNSQAMWMNTDSAQIIEYATTSASDDLSVMVAGFIDYI
jgi:hypothetical protein